MSSSPSSTPSQPDAQAAPTAGTPGQQQAVPPPGTVPTHTGGTVPPASLYVGDLSPEVSEAMLYDVFKGIGHILSIKVCRDNTSRRSLGYAYVNFFSPADAERAIETMNYTVIGKKPCRIMWSHRDPSHRKSGVGNIFIKNLDKTIDNQSLYDTFSDVGTILSCKIETDDKGVSKGFGYIHFESEESAKAAIDRVNGKQMAGKIVYVGPFLSRTERKTEELKQQNFTNVYVKNLDPSVDDQKLSEVFSKYGDITSATVMKTPAGVSRGFGFVNFKNHDASVAAVTELHGSVLAGKTLYASRAQTKYERQAELRKTFDNALLNAPAKSQGLNLYIKNLADDIDDDALRQLFAPHGTITSAKVMRDEKGGSKGFGFVAFSTQAESMKAISEMNGHLVHGKPIYVALAQKKEQRKAQLEALYSRGNMRYPAGAVQPPGLFPPPPMFYPTLPPQPRVMYQMPRGWAPPPNTRVMQNSRQGRGYPMQYPGGPMPAGPRATTMAQPRSRVGQPVVPATKQEAAWSGGRLKFSSTARNQPQMIPPAVPAPFPQPVQQVPPREEASKNEDAKQMVGERLFHRVAESIPPELCGKITGMLLESLGVGDVMNLLADTSGLLEKKTQEALAVLQEHMRKKAEGEEAPEATKAEEAVPQAP